MKGNTKLFQLTSIAPKEVYKNTALTPRPAHLSIDNLRARCFHIKAGPSRFVATVTALRHLRAQKSIEPVHARIIWEPETSECSRAAYGEHWRALALADVFAPSTRDLSRLLYDVDDPLGDSPALTAEQQQEIADCPGRMVEHMLSWCTRPFVIVETVDCNYSVFLHDDGTRHEPPQPPQRRSIHFANMHRFHPERVVDLTGSRSAFLGAFAVATALNRERDTPALWGAIAASYAMEQQGLPNLTRRISGEKWNKTDPMLRGMRYLRRRKSEGIIDTSRIRVFFWNTLGQGRPDCRTM